MEDLEGFFRTAVREIEPDPKRRTFAGLVAIFSPILLELIMCLVSLIRDPSGRFADGQFARIMQDSTESPGRQFRARGTPEVLCNE
jgi:hypothetical protein